MQNTTNIITAWELHQQHIPTIRIASYLGKHRETVGIWLQAIKEIGLEPFLKQYQQAKKGERKARQLNPVWKDRIYRIREREMNCCGEKIQYFLVKEYGVKISVPKIYEILAEKYQLRKRRHQNQARGPVPHAFQPRQVVQMDTVMFGEIFAFTGVDIFTKDCDVLLTPELTSNSGLSFLNQAMLRRFESHVSLIQTDGGPEFKGEFKAQVLNFCERHRVARPYRKNEQAFIESFNRTLRKECLGWKLYQKDQLSNCITMVENFLIRYHTHRPHMGLGMKTPLDFKSGLSDF